jgi:hypothetical protein
MKELTKKMRFEIRREYNFSGGVRGAKRYAEGTNVVVLEPDLVRAFPDSNFCQ